MDNESDTWEGLKCWLSGYAIGMIMAPRAIYQSAPIKYEYNEKVQLPPFSEYNKDIYPYICFYKEPTMRSTYIAYASSLPFEITGENNLVTFNFEANIIKSQIIQEKTNKWDNFETTSELLEFSPIWSNDDIKNSQGKIIIKTYKPIPIYSEEVLK